MSYASQPSPCRIDEAMSGNPFHLILIVDCSGSMAGKKVETLNFAIREAIRPLRDLAASDPQASGLMIRAISFANGARWHVCEATPIGAFSWPDLTLAPEEDLLTDMGQAFELLAGSLRHETLASNFRPPVLILAADGLPTDDWRQGLDTLMQTPRGQAAERLAIAIGEDADEDVLQAFIGDPPRRPMIAANTHELIAAVSAAVFRLQAAWRPGDQPPSSLSLPPIAADDVF